MVDVRGELERRLQEAFDAVAPGSDPVLRASDRADFQVNGVLGLARRLGRDPVELAWQVIEAAQLDDVCESVEISGPGFVNLTLSARYLTEQLHAMAHDERLGVPTVSEPATVLIDYSSPNVAKELHVGHLRSTVIGDALARVLGFLGHDVLRENHVGDWGTPFGMLIEHLVDLGEEKGVHELSVGDLDTFYRQARASFDEDPALQERSRQRVVMLQSGDPETLRLWRLLVAASVRYFDEVYAKLGVLLTDDDVVGESFYNAMLPDIVRELGERGLLVESEGALCVFPPGFANRDGDPLPLIVQKSDEGYPYAATDLAAIRDRIGRLGADLLLYVVGNPQAQHFEMCFAVARAAGWLPPGAQAVHVAFGNVLDAQHHMFKSRSGDNVKLVDLLDEAVERALSTVNDRRPELDAEEVAVVARILGIGAVKYADLSTDRQRDYVFDWDRMLAFEGDTAPYLQYAHSRIRSIFRRGGIVAADHEDAPVLDAPQERALALQLVGFPDAVRATAQFYAPSKLCGYLFDLATVFTTFYESCPVLRASTDDQRRSRLQLSDLTGRVLASGLELLGIAAPERM